MLTGDSADTAEAIRREVAPNGEISRLRTGVLPGRASLFL
jgi:cation transport ATPase